MSASIPPEPAITEVQLEKPELELRVRRKVGVELRAFRITRGMLTELVLNGLEYIDLPDWGRDWLNSIIQSTKSLRVDGFSLRAGSQAIYADEWIVEDEFGMVQVITDDNFKRNFDSA